VTEQAATTVKMIATAMAELTDSGAEPIVFGHVHDQN
jgi:hypothetical protein